MAHVYLLAAVTIIALSVSDAAEPDARLGLLATSLGVAPVPGYADKELHVAEEGHEVPLAVPYQNGGGQHGGNSPPGQCRCMPKEHCPGGGGNGGGGGGGPPPIIPVIGDGYNPKPNPDGGLTAGYGEPGATGGVNPAVDGAGVIDVRIVNRPAGGPQCLGGQIYCCPKDNGGSSGYHGSGAGSPGGPAGVDNGYVTCGARDIINIPGYSAEYGQAQFGSYPWMAVILGKGNNYVGAGALISPYYVLTAAHKVSSWKPGSLLKVRFGEWNAKDDDEPYKNIEIEVDRVIIHPQFNKDNLYNDIALVRLQAPIELNAFPHIKSVCLPSYGNNFVGTRCWVAGFGKDAFGNGKHSYIMREVDLPVVDNYDCERRLRGTRLGPQFELHKKSFLCAGGEEGKDACSGDGGSPLVCEYNGKWTVAGLVAWGIGCAEYGVPGVYVNVPNYVKWIEDNIYQ